MTLPAALPLISRGVPAYTNDDFSGSFPATNANNAIYGANYWRCATTPAGNANSGTLTQAVYLAYDLSSVLATMRQNVVLCWYNDPMTDPYDSSLISNNYYNVARDYTIDVNSAAGGTLPTTGWVTKVTVTNNMNHSRQHAFNLAGANWIRINVTGINGSVVNNNVALNMDVHDASRGNKDNWLLLGDSITQRGLDHDDQVLGPILAAQITANKSGYTPLMENGGLGGWTASAATANIASWLANFSGQYVSLNYGTNDANSGGNLVTTFQSNMTTLINAVINAGKIPVIPTIPWGSTPGLIANVPILNAIIKNLYGQFPQIVQGPDLYTYFSQHQSEISSDGIHPTDPSLSTGNGYVDYRALWASSLLSTVYSTPQPSSDYFEDAVMTLMQEDGTVVATNLLCQIDTVNIPLNMEMQGLIPTDWFDLYSLGWNSPVPSRSNYFVNQKTGTRYSVFGQPAVYADHLEARLTRYTGNTP